ncbi:hypothetical protein [Humisphaera borealis]|uniref:Uncharacterized protein n=1 Tax=Humisphaera borealis TaxID=2807512 RepID=A0A7M2WUJ3_9BACT|nr:hypothetical protein [Humisphaera borealis]QOV88471.1 hypothetical protein IPV69_19800 [Humisphaera borealis]
MIRCVGTSLNARLVQTAAPSLLLVSQNLSVSMPQPRRNLTPEGIRVVFAVWALALVLATALAFAAGLLQYWRIDRAMCLAAADRQLDDLNERIVPLFDRRQSVIESELLNGKPFVGDAAYSSGAAEPFAEPEARGLFRFAAPPGPATQTGVTSVVRGRVDAADISPQFAGWTLRLKFVNGRLAGASAHNPTRAELIRPISGGRPIQRAAEWMVVISGAIAILCLIAAGPVGDRWRRQVAATGLAAGVLVVVAACLHTSPSSRPALHQPSTLAAWALVLSALGLSAVAPARRRSASDRPRCPCGYDLTGNVSGICPECGRPTARGRIDRWGEHASAIDRVTTAPERFTGDYLPGGLIETKPLDRTAQPSPRHGWPAQFAAALAGATFACYRFRMTDARDIEGHPGAAADNPPIEPTAIDQSGNFVCPSCGKSFSPALETAGSDGLIACPACGYQSSYASDVSDADRELALRMEVEQRTREAHLNDIRVKQILTERRSLFRMRSYFVALAVTAAVAAGQLGIWSYGRLMRGGVDLFVIGYLAAILGLAVAAAVCMRQIRRYNAELATPMQTEDLPSPDFSTLSDGSQRLNSVADNLARLYERPK